MPLNFDIAIKYYVCIDISGLSIVFIIIILKASMVWRVAYFTARLSSGRSIVPLRLSLRRTKWQFWEFQTIDTNPLTIRVNIKYSLFTIALLIRNVSNVLTLIDNNLPIMHVWIEGNSPITKWTLIKKFRISRKGLNRLLTSYLLQLTTRRTWVLYIQYIVVHD